MPDSLKKWVQAYNKERNTDRQLERTERATSTRHVCISCRRSTEPPSAKRDDAGRIFLSLGVPCPICGGKVVSITY